MKIIVDAFGGDNAPLEVLKGCAMAVQEYHLTVVLTGDEEIIKKTAEENGVTLTGMEIVHAPDVVMVEDDPAAVIKNHGDSSLVKGLSLLAQGEGDAFVSAGSTGALVVGSSLLVKRIKGIKRAALAPIIPSNTGCYMLMDAGANLECRPEMLLQFGIMGSAYMNKIVKVNSPRVGLLNVGAEETKGTVLQKEAFALLKSAPVNFTGNIEPRDVPMGDCEVVVCDGFSGNIVLKLTEGLASAMMGNIKNILYKNTLTKLAAASIKGGLMELKKKMDYTEHGGAPLMGIAKPVIKAHGSSNANAFKNAIRQARDFVEHDVIGEIERSLEELKRTAQ
ncbi:phosphate acyltransferase PlsX [Zongyangia hominis]|uniref:Phosphate acyltransferase n=1 Tax=Zongyangia hominis TaxID=2763677 RepID=A0A926E7H5_9FIRM|nr:phosphate acyltransferase PlsX [Zongyangia hominis]MBC8569255.1 phosphate acyltransferase PlsX [Zongyangia hominis]